MKFSRLFRTPVAILAAAVIVSGSVFAFAASNTIDPSAAGAGVQPVSGYTTTNVTYKFNGDNLEYVQFTLVPAVMSSQFAASHAQVKLNEAVDYQEATMIRGTIPASNDYTTVWAYTTTVESPITVTSIDNLSVVAASGPTPVVP